MPIKTCIVGSLHCGKGQHEAINALSTLVDKFPRMTLNIVGDGNELYTKELRRLCSKYKLSSNVIFSGYSNRVQDVFKESDISIVCSRSEAFGRVIVESMAEGCPVVAAHIGGIPEIIKHGENGLMYDRDYKNDLVEQITTLINDTELYSKISRNGMEDVYTRFSRKKLGEVVYSIMDRVAST